ncbi:acyl-CoA thioesterase [Orrella marina]|nr:thioesterase family protein [Orrella marina]
MSQRRLQPGDTFEIDIEMRWADSDMMQHLNNAKYFQYMEQARVMLMDQSGVRDFPDLGFVVAHCSCDFKKAITYPATVKMRLITDRVGRTSFDHRVEMSVQGDPPGQFRATGRAVMVLVNRHTGQSTPWPDGVLERLGSVTQPAVADS